MLYACVNSATQMFHRLHVYVQRHVLSGTAANTGSVCVNPLCSGGTTEGDAYAITLQQEMVKGKPV